CPRAAPCPGAALFADPLPEPWLRGADAPQHQLAADRLQRGPRQRQVRLRRLLQPRHIVRAVQELRAQLGFGEVFQVGCDNQRARHGLSPSSSPAATAAAFMTPATASAFGLTALDETKVEKPPMRGLA